MSHKIIKLQSIYGTTIKNLQNPCNNLKSEKLIGIKKKYTERGVQIDKESHESNLRRLSSRKELVKGFMASIISLVPLLFWEIRNLGRKRGKRE